MVRPGFKQTEVGEIPEDWNVQCIETLGNGSIPPIKAGPFGSSLTKDTYVKAGYKVYGQEQVIRGDYLYGDYYISQFKYRELESCAVRPGDILLSLVGTAGKLLVIPENAPEGIINPRLIRFSFDKERIFPYFFKELFESDQIQKYLARYAQGGTMSVLNASMLRPVNIPLPSIEEQKTIAKALSDVDELIVSMEKLIAKKRDIKTATMQQLLTGKTRLPGFGEGKDYKQTELGEIPEDWDVKKLGEFLKYEQPTKYLVGNTEYCENGEVPVLTAGKTFILGYTHEEYGFFESLPVIIFDDFTTDTKFVDFRFKVKSSAMKMLLPRTTNVNLHYIFTLMQMIVYPLGDHKRYWIGEYQYIDIAVPSSKNEQEAISRIISEMELELRYLSDQLEKTKAIKQGMMQELLTGRTRLVDVPAHQADRERLHGT